jgi:hypothetical protein
MKIFFKKFIIVLLLGCLLMVLKSCCYETRYEPVVGFRFLGDSTVNTYKSNIATIKTIGTDSVITYGFSYGDFIVPVSYVHDSTSYIIIGKNNLFRDTLTIYYTRSIFYNDCGGAFQAELTPNKLPYFSSKKLKVSINTDNRANNYNKQKANANANSNALDIVFYKM